MKTQKEAADQFIKAGITVSEWSRQHGFKAHQVRDVLRGKSKGNYGAAHKIAVALGIKEHCSSAVTFGAGIYRD